MIWKFRPLEKRTIWGGGSLADIYPALSAADGTPSPEKVGEVWILSGVPGSETRVVDGPDNGKQLDTLVKEYGPRLLGEKNANRFGNTFPLLIKFIDAADDLSVQVHPDDAMAQSHGKPFGKTEMWYVVGTRGEARLAAGFNAPVNPDDFKQLTDSGEITDRLRYTTVKEEEVYFIPAGRVHALGKGCIVLEIQETSDETYRLYDYHRKDAYGNERQLHTEQAREASDFNDTNGIPTPYDTTASNALLVDCPHFTTRRLTLDAPASVNADAAASFKVIIAVKGSATLRDNTSEAHIEAGECLLISADTPTAEILPKGHFEALLTYIR